MGIEQGIYFDKERKWVYLSLSYAISHDVDTLINLDADIKVFVEDNNTNNLRKLSNQNIYIAKSEDEAIDIITYLTLNEGVI